MGSCSTTKRKIRVSSRKRSSDKIRKILLFDVKEERNNLRNSLSRKEGLVTSNEINLMINNKRENNKSMNNISLYSKIPKPIIIRPTNKSSNKLIKCKSKEKVINNLKDNSIKCINYNSNINRNNVKSNYVHLKSRSSSSKYDTSSINSSINNTSQILNNNLQIILPKKLIKTGLKCKNKNRIPRSTYESNNSNLSSSNTGNYKIKISKKYNYTYNQINDENINFINKNIYNIYSNNNININFYRNYKNNSNRKNRVMYRCIKTIEGHNEKIVSIIELSNGLIATGSYDCKIKIWNIAKSICIKSINEKGKIFCLLEMEPNFILSGTNKNTIQLYDINTLSKKDANEILFSFKGHDLWVNCLVKCNSQYFSSGSNDADIKIWDYYNKSLYKTLKGHEDCILTMTILKNDFLCSGSADLSIKIWDWREGNCVTTLYGHEKWVKSICELENGYLISGSDDMTIKIWKDNKCIKDLKGHTHSIRTLCKISDNEFASGSFDGTIKIWDINSLDSIQTLVGHQSYVISVIHISNGDLISCSNDHSIKIWGE